MKAERYVNKLCEFNTNVRLLRWDTEYLNVMVHDLKRLSINNWLVAAKRS